MAFREYMGMTPEERAAQLRNNSALLRPTEQWMQIIREQTDGSAAQVAARVLGDVYHYTSSRKKDGYPQPVDGLVADIEQIGRAMEAYASIRVEQALSAVIAIQQGIEEDTNAT